MKASLLLFGLKNLEEDFENKEHLKYVALYTQTFDLKRPVGYAFLDTEDDSDTEVLEEDWLVKENNTLKVYSPLKFKKIFEIDETV